MPVKLVNTPRVHVFADSTALNRLKFEFSTSYNLWSFINGDKFPNNLPVLASPEFVATLALAQVVLISIPGVIALLGSLIP